MPVSEYVWILNHLLVALKYAEASGAPPPLKAFRSAFDRLLPEGATAGEYEPPSDRMDWNYELGVYAQLKNLLPEIDPRFIRLPEEHLQAVLENLDDLTMTMDLFVHFDTRLKRSNLVAFQLYAREQ